MVSRAKNPEQIHRLRRAIKHSWYPDKILKQKRLLTKLEMEDKGAIESETTINSSVSSEGHVAVKIGNNYKLQSDQNDVNIMGDILENTSCSLHTGSSIAKSGYNEEELICKDLNENNNDVCEILKNLNVFNRDTFKVLKGNSKVDVSNGVINFQVKKYTRDAMAGQLDRHWTSDVVKVIPELEPIKPILVGLCELPLCEDDKKKCDKNKPVIKLCNSIYSEDQLALFIKTLNENKKDLLNYVFFGTDKTTTPEFIIGVQYINGGRNNITIYNISDVIDILMEEDFEIRKSKTVFGLGKSFSFQRKGGDNGAKSANQLQCKFSFQTFRESFDSKITNKVTINL
jgi:hypothetical protein